MVNPDLATITIGPITKTYSKKRNVLAVDHQLEDVMDGIA